MVVLTSAFTTMKASASGCTLQSGVVDACNPKFSIRRHVAAGRAGDDGDVTTRSRRATRRAGLYPIQHSHSSVSARSPPCDALRLRQTTCFAGYLAAR